MYDDPRVAQAELELKYDTEAAASRLAELQKKSSEGDVQLPRAARLIGRMFGEVQVALENVKAVSTRGLGGKYKTWLRTLPTDVAALIAVRECISMCTSHKHERPVQIQDLAGNIGKLWETEVRVREAEAVNPLYMKRIYDQIKERGTTNAGHLRRTYNVAYTRIMKGELDSSLSKGELIQIGKFGVQACLDAGLIEQFRGKSRQGTVVWFELAPEAKEFVQGYSDKDVSLVVDRSMGAMRCPPDDWTTSADGGYLTPRRKFAYPLRNLRYARGSVRRRLLEEFTAEKMPQVFQCANYLQSNAFRIHMPTLSAILKVWGTGGGAMGVPRRSEPVKPECPVPQEWVAANGTPEELEVFSAWKREVVRYYENLREWRGKVREIGGFLKASTNYSGPIWFPVFVDSRGRWYYRGTPNPQGSDLAKAVLHWDTKKPLGKRGVYWLKVSIANAYGFDKDRFDDRVRWTEQHWDVIEKALDEPENRQEVFGNDSPWVMFSAAWELREAYRSGNPETYETGIVVHMDATCSGLQHFSAMLRDPVGGQYVNLVDEAHCGPKQDIYSKVSTNALLAIKQDLGGEHDAMARFWLEVGIPRALAKKPVK